MDKYKHLNIKQLPHNERPYEKLEDFGAERLTDAELLAIIIKTGTKYETAVNLAQRILKNTEEWVEEITQISLNDLMKINGIGRVKAIQIKAVLELGKRFVSFKKNTVLKIKTPKDVSDFLMEEMRFLTKEHVKALLLNTKNELMKLIDIAVGSLNSSIIHPREVFSYAVKFQSASIILVHNHPSGDPAPSKEDILITQKLFEASKILGIELLDHVIIGNKEFVSLKEKTIF